MPFAFQNIFVHHFFSFITNFSHVVEPLYFITMQKACQAGMLETVSLLTPHQ